MFSVSRERWATWTFVRVPATRCDAPRFGAALATTTAGLGARAFAADREAGTAFNACGFGAGSATGSGMATVADEAADAGSRLATFVHL
jgi:hypothetical protein